MTGLGLGIAAAAAIFAACYTDNGTKAGWFVFIALVATIGAAA